MVWDNAPCLKRFLSILGTSFYGTILILNYFIELGTIRKYHWQGGGFSIFTRKCMSMSHNVMSYCIISCHIMSCIRHVFIFYLVSRTCWFLSLWSGVVHTSWGKYTLNSFASGAGIKKVWTSLGGQHFWNHSGMGVKYFSGISLSYLPVPHVHELICRGWGWGGGQNKWTSLG